MAEKTPRIHESWEYILHSQEPLKPEHEQRETLRHTVRQEVERFRVKPLAPPPSAAPKGGPASTHEHPRENELRGLEESRQLNFLAHLALEEGIEPAVRLAERLGTPYIIDALHDFIADRLLAVLTQRRVSRQSP